MKKLIITCIFVIIIIALTLIHSRYKAIKKLEINEYKITNSELNKDFYGLKIVHFSDLYYGDEIDIDDVNNLVYEINLTKPDIVIFTGDLGKYDDKLKEALNNINVSIEKIAIKGDKDKNVDEFLNSTGFIVLDNSYELVYTKSNNYILIAGLSSNNKDKTKIEEKLASTIEFINNNEIKPSYSILLMHEPDYIDKVDLSNFNLVLSGHGLGGLFKLPFIGPIVKKNGYQKYVNNHYIIKNTDFYISNGIGIDDIKFRFLNTPSFNLYRLVN